MRLRPLSSVRHSQRGVATLVVALLMLFVVSLGALYVNRGVMAEQRASGNQMQATLTQEVAEAGIEWATGMLNAPYDIGPDCKFSNAFGNESFRKRYAFTEWDAATPSTDVKPAAIYPGCKINPTSGALTCQCPTVDGTVADAGAAEQPGFSVAFEPVPDPDDATKTIADAVKVTSWACTAQSGKCGWNNYTEAEGHARVSVILKLGLAPRAPAAPLTCGTSCDVKGSFNIVNKDVATNGILINAGTTIAVAGSTTMESLEGQPVNNAKIADDPSLLALSSSDPTCDKSAMFKAYFSMTIERFRDSPTTKVLSCGSASDCKNKLDTAYNEGWRSFYFETDLQLSGNNTYGSQADPIILVTPNAIKINGNNVFYGLIFSNSADWNDIGTGSATIHGAQVTCAAYNTNGNGTLNYDPDALKNARRMSAPMARVPGSWRDFILDSDAKK